MSAEVRTTHIPGGYCGSTDYEIEGSFDDVTTAVEAAKRSWPPPGYGTWFNWPPGALKNHEGKLITYLAPTDLGDGRWIARGHRSNSSD